MSRFTVYDGNNQAISRVRFNDNLDTWDGRNWNCGSVGMHKGLTKLRTGEYVLIRASQWQGEGGTAEIIEPLDAIKEIIHSGNIELLELKKFRGLKELAEREGLIGDEEMDDDD